MNLQYLTEEGKQMLHEAIDYNLVTWYDPMNGNYIFDNSDFYENQGFIIRFLKDHCNYGLKYDDDVELWILYDIEFY